ncbi:peptidoglycan recognition family protein [Nonomuraea sp. NPDC050786]|uniref:peptidoglycan recognition protein family protein n=1 Tax=Nonomuraea sp. NPDC050786 TaxID=3154840 RepID=UPI0033C4838E
MKIHYTGGRENPDMAGDHALCKARVRGVQSGHMSGNGWIDIGYSWVVCHHGQVFTGRGFGHLPAANGAGLNSGHYAILGLVGTSGLTKPSDAMKAGIRDLIDWLRGKGVGNEIKGHRDGYATDCPGPELYAWVKAGAPRPGGKPSSPKPSPTPSREDDDMDYTSLALSAEEAVSVPAGAWITVPFDTEHADPTKDHADGLYPSFLNGPARYQVDIDVSLTGLREGEEVLTRLVEVQAGTSPGEIKEATKDRPVLALPREDGVTWVTHQGLGSVAEGRKLRLQIQHTGSGPVTLTGAWVRMLSFPS